MPFQVEGLDHVALGVSDQGAEESWFTDVLGLRREFASEWGDTPVALMAGGSGLALFRSGDDEPDAGLRHIAFRVDRANFEAAQDDLRARGIPFELADHDVAHSIYFEDPAGLRLELTTYEL
jgi:catechol 2,3-dioxygenase-like lactoylglutathione lyase family enzyme